MGQERAKSCINVGSTELSWAITDDVYRIHLIVSFHPFFFSFFFLHFIGQPLVTLLAPVAPDLDLCVLTTATPKKSQKKRKEKTPAMQ